MKDPAPESSRVVAAYAQGRACFMGLEMLVAPGVLVPRAETELLGTVALRTLGELAPPASRVIDMCCGSGNLACAIAHHAPGSRIWASDLSDDAATIARRNVAFHEFSERVFVRQGDLFSAFSEDGLDGTIDLVVCNPPYISETRLDTERAHLLELEPRIAFAAGPYGISIHQRVARDALAFLRPRGVLLFEVGLGQAQQVKRLLERTRAYEHIDVADDSTGQARVVLAIRSAS